LKLIKTLTKLDAILLFDVFYQNKASFLKRNYKYALWDCSKYTLEREWLGDHLESFYNYARK